jgi:hypothetical protein
MTPEQIAKAEKLVREWQNNRGAETTESVATDEPTDLEASSETAPEFSTGLKAYQSGD